MNKQWFDVLIIDPPWNKRKGGLRKVRPHQGTVFDYSTMSLEEIERTLTFNILPLAKSHHVVFMWETDGLLGLIEPYMLRNGYKRHCRFIWDKLNGIAPAFTVRYSHEYLVWWYKPRFLPIAKEYRGKFRTVFSERARQHSRKPDVAYDIIEKLYPTHSKIDVFSREKREGWSQWGNELDYFT